MAPLAARRVAVWLYGSVARGDNDGFSDVDILVVADEPRAVDKEFFTHLLGSTDRPSPTYYTWDEIDAMVSYGSLFLHHVQLEGRCISEMVTRSSPTLADRLASLGPYKHARRDVQAFKTTIGDVVGSVRAGGSPLFELSVLGTVFRHASVLACYVAGRPTFGRAAAFTQVIRLLDVPDLNADSLSKLYQFRLHEDGRAPAPFQPLPRDVLLWCSLAECFLERISEVVDVYEDSLDGAAR